MPGDILILDDEKNYLLVLDSILSDEGYKITALSDPEMGLAFLEESEVDVVVTDMKMPKLTGKDVLDHAKKHYPYIPVLIMTAFGSIEAAVEAMRTGAFDYITKPFSNEELLLSISKAMQFARAQQENRALRQQIQERFGPENIVARDKSMRHVLDMVHRAAPSRSTVLVTGESGTGKELVAKAIHNQSPRKDGPFISVNCMALNPGVLESELFGHEKGSFTGAVSRRRGRFELADKGTLFLDEIGELSHDMQVKLLRVLQERCFERVGGTDSIEVDIRIVAATNRDLTKAVA
ncbi:MAG: sigma-54 dependent transcriptional regulator, partial [Desulfovibrionaceae bacterium]|nr:sigma-54 dependent transcriptional regulator [Desulfovibrionaceae bacterium]